MRTEEEFRERLEFLKKDCANCSWYGNVYSKEFWKKQIETIEWGLEPAADVLDDYYHDEDLLS
jgi:hypothetical protein